MEIQVLGTGCAKCGELEKRVKDAVAKAGVKATVEHVYDVEKIIAMNIFSTPALVIDGKVVFSGRIPGVDELVKLIEKHKK
ncbi:MAG: thioredoxin family protein [Candidatus Micrarchaeia archaeon]